MHIYAYIYIYIYTYVLELALVAQSCQILCDPTDYTSPGSSVHGILKERILEWVAILLSRGFTQLRNQIQVTCNAGRFFTIWASRVAHIY